MFKRFPSIILRQLKQPAVGVVACAAAMLFGAAVFASADAGEKTAKGATSEIIAAEESAIAEPVAANASELMKPALTARVVTMEVTAYCPCKKCCGKNTRGITASGKNITYNNGVFVAADTRVLPFGTRLLIPGYSSDRPAEVIDRGGAIKGKKLDVYFRTHAEALKWGRQKLAVMIVD